MLPIASKGPAIASDVLPNASGGLPMCFRKFVVGV